MYNIYYISNTIRKKQNCGEITQEAKGNCNPTIPFGYIVRRGTTELHGVLPCHFGGCYCFPSCLC